MSFIRPAAKKIDTNVLKLDVLFQKVGYLVTEFVLRDQLTGARFVVCFVCQTFFYHYQLRCRPNLVKHNST